MQDVVFLDTMAHFGRERIPERVVHAKGAGECRVRGEDSHGKNDNNGDRNQDFNNADTAMRQWRQNRASFNHLPHSQTKTQIIAIFLGTFFKVTDFTEVYSSFPLYFLCPPTELHVQPILTCLIWRP
jgi:catalase